ncbi:Alpha-L-arabinofuranosidase 1 [Zea mays]|uniref:Alpha-L-arabinofuranosidase 1 n=1 Tax=Zea mays TaxID=4577 RepID=A0A1D6JP53_MAIZE|nr:Alpha-L-arabinofuranosidase 1 [Zea mays]
MNDISGQRQQVCDTIVKFYSAIKASYPDIKIISSCDRSATSSDNPADLYDVHVYTLSGDMFFKSSMFANTARTGPKVLALLLLP